MVDAERVTVTVVSTGTGGGGAVVFPPPPPQLSASSTAANVSAGAKTPFLRNRKAKALRLTDESKRMECLEWGSWCTKLGR